MLWEEWFESLLSFLLSTFNLKKAAPNEGIAYIKYFKE